jgi:hypothetical protein
MIPRISGLTGFVFKAFQPKLKPLSKPINENKIS